MEGLREADLARWWRRRRGRHTLRVGEEVWEVVYPGRANGEGGPDFKGAILAREDGSLVRGDVEVHLLSSQWRAHGHHGDPTYNGVVLHLVSRDDAGATSRRQDGVEVPAAEAGGWMGEGGLVGGLGEVSALASAEVGEILDRAGDERFEEKAALLEAEMAGAEPGQVLYRGLLGALGYARNKAVFREVADRLPLACLEGYILGKEPEEALALAEALLLGTTGLLPSHRADVSACGHPWLARLEAAWARWGGEALGSSRWLCLRGRPGNHPARRLAGAAALAVRYRMPGLLPGLRALLESGASLAPGLVVAASGFWQHHLEPGGRPLPAPGALVGLGRAREMAVNAALPFFLAWARREGLPDLVGRCWDVYRGYPQLPDNGILRHLAPCLGPIALSARRQQGALHWEREVCSQGGCRDCPLTGR